MTVFRHFRVLIAGFALVLLWGGAASGAIVRDIRLGAQSGSNARVVIDLDEKVDFKIFPLKKRI